MWQKLSGLDLQIRHIPGKENVLADPLTRQHKYYLASLEPPQLHDSAQRERWRDEYLKDPILRTYWLVLAEGNHSFDCPKEVSCSGGLLRKDGKIFVPRGMLFPLLRSAHDRNGHGGVTKTTEALQRYLWPGKSTDIKDYILGCPDCQRDKPRSHLPYGVPTPLLPASKPFERIHID